MALRASGQKKGSREQRRDCGTGTLQTNGHALAKFLNTTENSANNSSNLVSSVTPNPKRRKLIHTVSDQIFSPKMASVENMYDFSDPKQGGGKVIDLTSSPIGSPRVRRSSTSAGVMVPTTPQTGTRKLIVKNFRSSPRSDPAVYCEKTMIQVEDALTAIFKREKPTLSNEELYKGVENLCKLRKAEMLSKKLFLRCKAHVSGQIRSKLDAKVSVSDENLLPLVVDAWRLWLEQVKIIQAIFFYLDRAYLLQHGFTLIYEKLVEYFRTYIFEDNVLKEQILNGTCSLLHDIRHGSPDQSARFAQSVTMLVELGGYTTEFEPKLLANSQCYFVAWSEKFRAEKELPEYVSECNKLINAEETRCRKFHLLPTTQRQLFTLLESICIENQEATLTNSDAVADLLDENNVAELAKLYQLLQKRHLETRLREPFVKWIDETGSAVIFDEKKQDQLVPRLLQLKSNLDNVWRTAFSKNDLIGFALREAFESFINKSKKTSAAWNTDNSKTGEMIAKYVDQLLRAGAKAIPANLTSTSRPSGPTPGLGKMDIGAVKIRKASAGGAEDEEDERQDDEEEVNLQLDQVLDLFRFLHGKAVFEAFYKKDLARRLLMGRSASNDAERSMLDRLKSECGSGFTQNLEQMFRDVELAREEMASYRSRTETREHRPNVDLTVNILSAAAWPSYPDLPVVIPSEIRKAVDAFEAHYQTSHTGRKLIWKHALAHCQMKATFPKGSKELIVSSFQAITLLLFNGLPEGERLGYEHLKAETGLSEVELKRTLQSLACARLRPLTKYPKGRDVNETDAFGVNTLFEHPKYRVKINQIQLKETKEENKETHERVAADRQYETQAAIVRIMKGRKTIGHQELIAETIKATRSRGVLQPNSIKKEIDKLIDKEYMERAEGNTYAYLA